MRSAKPERAFFIKILVVHFMVFMRCTDLAKPDHRDLERKSSNSVRSAPEIITPNGARKSAVYRFSKRTQRLSIFSPATRKKMFFPT